MSADRLIPTSATVGPITGDDFMDATQEELTALFNASNLPLTNIGGSASAITADVSPDITSSLVDGMKFSFRMGASANSGAATLKIGTQTALNILRYDGSALVAGDIPANTFITVMKVTISSAAKFVMLTPPPIAPGAAIDRQVFISSGTWTKPSGYNPNALVIIEIWSGGGGGGAHASGGGGAGGYRKRIEKKLSDLTSTVAVTVGAGGAVNTVGGDTSFGSYVTAYGGGPGQNSSTGSGGGTAGAFAAGAVAVGGAPDGVGAAGETIDAGGGGGGGSGNGGRSVYGGGGGGAGPSGTGGSSIYGGNGGNSGSAGTAPGGGGGRNGAGARGEVRVTIIG